MKLPRKILAFGMAMVLWGMPVFASDPLLDKAFETVNRWVVIISQEIPTSDVSLKDERICLNESLTRLEKEKEEAQKHLKELESKFDQNQFSALMFAKDQVLLSISQEEIYKELKEKQFHINLTRCNLNRLNEKLTCLTKACLLALFR